MQLRTNKIRNLDLRGVRCPMTFVKTRLALDSMAPGDRLEILVNEEEPRLRLPLTIVELGHTLVEQVTDDHAVMRILVEHC